MSELPIMQFPDESPLLDSVIDWQQHLHDEALRVRELKLQALIQPKPWWLPTPVWYWLVSRVVVIVDVGSGPGSRLGP